MRVRTSLTEAALNEEPKTGLRLPAGRDVVVLSPKRNDEQEFVVKLMKNGREYTPATYYTNDWDDAVATARHMAHVGQQVPFAKD